MPKADSLTATRVLRDLFHNIWENDTIPEDWSKGLISHIEAAKKGDIGNSNNWRGITLLSIPSKVYCKILLNQMKDTTDLQLCKEQANFRKGQGCTDQIFALMNIIEKCLEWNAPCTSTLSTTKRLLTV